MNDFPRQTVRICQILQRVLSAKEKADSQLSSDWADWEFGLSVRHQIHALGNMARQIERLFTKCFGVSVESLAKDGTVLKGLVEHRLPSVVRHAYVDFNTERIRLSLQQFTSDQSGHRPHGCLDAAELMRDHPTGYSFWIHEGFRVLKEDYGASVCPVDEEKALDSQCLMLEIYVSEYEHLVERMRDWSGIRKAKIGFNLLEKENYDAK